MRSNRGKDTLPELLARSALHKAGYRFFKNRKPLAGVRCEVDIIFVRARLAIFIDGCFWHGCPTHATWPATNRDWWAQKLNSNRARDKANSQALQRAGWSVLRVWAHDAPEVLVAEVERRLAVRSGRTPATRS